MIVLTSCATNEFDAKIESSRYAALEDINKELNKSDRFECKSGCIIEIASRNKIKFTADMLQEFGAIDRLVAGGVSIAEIIARGVFNPATLQAFAMYKGLEVVAGNGGIRNTNSYNSSGGNTETGSVDSSTIDSNDDNSDNSDNSAVDDNSDNSDNSQIDDNSDSSDNSDNSNVDSNDDNSSPVPPVEEVPNASN